MATAKKEIFDAHDVELAEMAKALSHPARIAILRVLAGQDVCICGDIVDEVPLAQATVSQHLKVLRSAGFIAGEIVGPRSCYCLDRERLARVQHHLGHLFEGLFDKGTCC